MSRWAVRAAMALTVLAIGACATYRSRPVEAPAPPPLLLISIDGFRHDYLERADTPTLDRLAAAGRLLAARSRCRRGRLLVRRRADLGHGGASGPQSGGLLDAMHLLVVSDHGMAATDAERLIVLDDYLDLSRVHVSDWGPAAHIWAGDMSTDQIVAALESAHPRLRVWRQSEIPERYHFRDHPRVPDVLAEADLGCLISSRAHVVRTADDFPRGMHGWDPRHPEMHGIFLAHGPAFASGDRMGRVEAIHLYELMAALLGLEPSPNDGRLAVFAGHVTGVRPPR